MSLNHSVPVRLDDELYDELKLIACSLGVPVSVLMRAALRHYVRSCGVAEGGVPLFLPGWPGGGLGAE